jgi:hypothetical protein
MKKFKRFTGYAIISLILISLLFMFDCKKDEAENTAPDLPPIGTMEMDFSSFSSSTKAAMVTDSLSYWGASVYAVTFWSVAVAVVTVVPVTAFKASFQNKAVYDGDNSWHWSYSVKAGLNTYTAKLKATLESDSVDWKMYLSKTGLNSFDDFLWFEGKSEYALSGGWWLLYESPAVPEEFLKIDWKRQNDSIGSLKYTYVKPADPTKIGGYIEFGLTNQNGIYNAFYNLYAKDKDELATIQWSTITKEGRVKDSVYFKNDFWHCWNSSLVNTVCPEK